MTKEPSASSEAQTAPPIREIAPGVPIEFETPERAAMTWNRDSEHLPRALTPLAADYARVLGASLNKQYPVLSEAFPQRWHMAIWHGYAYYAFERNATAEEWTAISSRMDALTWERAQITDAYWENEVVPELQGIYARIDAVDADRSSGADLADAWDGAWLGVERAWHLHMDVLPALYRTTTVLDELYRSTVPDAPRGDVYRLIPGSEHELFRMERATEDAARLAAALPAVAGALRSGTRSLSDLSALEGGPAFVELVMAILAEHGHLGQLGDDLNMPSFGEEPALYLTEIAKRLASPAADAEQRRIRLRDDADALAAGASARLADTPQAQSRFDAVVALARTIGPLSERHNYWIDRAAQAHLRRLATRVGGRLTRDGVIDRSEDVFYLGRAEIAELLRHPEDRRTVVAARRAQHEVNTRIKPAASVGPDADYGDHAAVSPDPGPALPADQLTGTGASPGIARGTARVVKEVDEFGRVAKGDIVVTHFSNSSWVPIFSIAGGLITEVGGLLSHAAVVAREFGLPAVVGVRGATAMIRDGQDVEIDGTAGTIRLLTRRTP